MPCSPLRLLLLGLQFSTAVVLSPPGSFKAHPRVLPVIPNAFRPHRYTEYAHCSLVAQVFIQHSLCTRHLPGAWDKTDNRAGTAPVFKELMVQVISHPVYR